MRKLIAPLLFLLAVLFAAPAQAQMACPDPFSARGPCTAVTASASGTTGATTATIPAVSGKTAYICGFYFAGTNATAANPTTTVTITGTITGTMNFGYPTLALGATVPNAPPVTSSFTPCVPASAINTAIVVNGPALGAGATLATVTSWGYYL